MNINQVNSTQATYRFTGAFYLLIATVLSSIVMVSAFCMDLSWIYIVSIPVTAMLFMATAAVADQHRK